MDFISLPTSAAHESSRSRIAMVHAFTILAIAVAFRCWRIDHVPGVNGDEAWMGVQALRFLDGQSVRWFTPTGNPMNLFHFAPMVLLHLVGTPSVTLLRTTVLISGLLVLPVNYFLCRRVFGVRMASISTIILAVLPINIAYSRFAWDASQSLLFTLPSIYCSLLAISEPQRRLRWLVIASFALGAALMVHPTNVFIAPMVAWAGLYAFREPLVAAIAAVKTSWRYRLVWMGCILAVAAVMYVGAARLQVAGQRLASFEQMALFASYTLDLFSGTTAVRYIAGTQAVGSATDVVLYRLAVGSFCVFAAYGLIQTVRQRASGTSRVLILGALASALGFYLVAGPSAMAPGYERYAICLIGPGAILMAMGVTWWCGRHRVIAGISGAAVAWLLLIGFYTHYIRAIEETGGQAHLTFRTAAIEPKQAACYLMQRIGSPEQPLTVVATEWWNYWPMAYLAHRIESLRIVGSEVGDPALGLSDPHVPIPFLERMMLAPEANRVCFVEFESSDVAQSIQHRLKQAGILFSTATIRDASHRPVLTIVRPLRHQVADR